MKNKPKNTPEQPLSGRQPSQGREPIIDRLAGIAETVVDSRAYRNSHRIAVFLLGMAVAVGIGKGLADQNNSVPDRPEQSVTIVEDE